MLNSKGAIHEALETNISMVACCIGFSFSCFCESARKLQRCISWFLKLLLKQEMQTKEKDKKNDEMTQLRKRQSSLAFSFFFWIELYRLVFFASELSYEKKMVAFSVSCFVPTNDAQHFKQQKVFNVTFRNFHTSQRCHRMRVFRNFVKDCIGF